MKTTHHKAKTHIIKQIEQASEFQVLLALGLVYVLRFYRRYIAPPPPRVHWVGAHLYTKPKRSLRPLQLLVPVLLTEFFLISTVVAIAPRNALLYGFLGNLCLVAVIMSPAFLKPSQQ